MLYEVGQRILDRQSRMLTLYVLFVVGILTLIAITQLRKRIVTENFEDVTPQLSEKSLDAIQELLKLDRTKLRPAPEFFQTARSMLDKYDNPELWNTAVSKIGADPGQLARQHLGIINE
jgi:hypothetical protein